MTGLQLWIVFGVLFLIGCAIYTLVILRDESDFGPDVEQERRRQLDAATETPLAPIRRHALLERRKR